MQPNKHAKIITILWKIYQRGLMGCSNLNIFSNYFLGFVFDSETIGKQVNMFVLTAKSHFKWA
jgi:hypothetical protein